MSTDRLQRIQDHLAQLENLDAARRLLADLNYDVTRDTLPRHDWPQAAAEALAEDPQIIAQHDDFHVIYCRLQDEEKLLLTPQRAVVNHLLKDHPFALFLFSDQTQDYWHFLNVKYEAQQDAASRRVFRRITVGPYERRHRRLRTAAERVALLDLETIDRDLFGISPLAIQQRHDEAFDVERVTRDFFKDYRQIFEYAEASIEGLEDKEDLRLFTQRLFNRLMFVIFLERKGWLTLNRRDDYLRALWHDHKRQQQEEPDVNFFQHRLKLLFFAGLNTRNEIDVNTGVVDTGGEAIRTTLHDYIGDVPYLNGGLFEEDELDRAKVTISDEVFRRALDDLFYHYNFTVTESTPLDVEVAVDPEMLGRIFEELVTGRHETGSYYTPKPVVSFMGREALKGYLETNCPLEGANHIAAFVDERDATRLRDPEAVLRALKEVTICDPACGSGAYLVGMLHELLYLRHALFASRELDDITIYDRKLEIIQHNLYGVDIDPFAVNIARLRLWLSLVVDFEGAEPEPLPNLDFKIEVGDSLAAPDPRNVEVDMFRKEQIERLRGLKADYMISHGEKKRILRRQIDDLKETIAEWIKGERRQGLSLRATSFDWAVEFVEIFAVTDVTSCGFDIVLANPPYVRQELIDPSYKKILSALYSRVHSGRADIYVYFYVRSFQLLCEGGVLVFISSNKWLRAKYGSKLRRTLAKTADIRLVIDFGELPVFESVSTFPMIIVGGKGKTQSTPMFAQVKSLDPPYPNLRQVVQAIGQELPSDSITESQWRLADIETIKFLKTVEQQKVTLHQYTEGAIFTGVKTGLNSAFVIDLATRNQLLDADSKSSSIIKPWLRGRDLRPWRIDWQELFVIFTYHGVDITQYPAVEEYLRHYKSRLEKRATSSKHAWYELQQPQMGIFRQFERSKIVYPDITKAPRFAFDRDGQYYIDMTAFIIPKDDLYLLGILKSSTVWEYLQNTAAVLGDAEKGGRMRLKSSYMYDLPIPVPSKTETEAVVNIVEQCLAFGGEESQLKALESQLNDRVAWLYGLSEIESSVYEGDKQVEL